MRRLLVSICVLSAVNPVAASAHDHQPPRSSLRTEDASRSGRPLSSFWTKARGNLCIDVQRDNSVQFPKPLRAPVQEPGTIRLHKADPPTSVSVRAWRRVDREGNPKGATENLTPLLQPHLAEGEVRAWDVVIPTSGSPRHYYLRLDAQWQDGDGCGGSPDLGYQHAAWTFHLKTI